MKRGIRQLCRPTHHRALAYGDADINDDKIIPRRRGPVAVELGDVDIVVETRCRRAVPKSSFDVIYITRNIT